MNLKGQHIGRLFTFLAGLIILAHAVVPHHHHFEITHSAYEKSTCESSTQDNKTENPDSHCHLFNVLISEKRPNFSLNQPLSDYFNFFFTGITADIEIPPFKIVTTTIFGHTAIFLKQFFITALSLRGPPAIP